MRVTPQIGLPLVRPLARSRRIATATLSLLAFIHSAAAQAPLPPPYPSPYATPNQVPDQIPYKAPTQTPYRTPGQTPYQTPGYPAPGYQTPGYQAPGQTSVQIPGQPVGRVQGAGRIGPTEAVPAVAPTAIKPAAGVPDTVAPVTPPATIAPTAPVAPAPPTTPAAPAKAPAPAPKKASSLTLPGYLDRLRAAESGGHDDAANPHSTAVGPYQFIESTWLELVHRVFATETQAMAPAKVLALRTDPAFSRRVAEAYTSENAGLLKAAGVEPTFPHLRIAHLLGPQGAIRVLTARPEQPVPPLVGPAVVAANPFLVGMSQAMLVARASRELSVEPGSTAGVTTAALTSRRQARPGLLVRCNLNLPACRHWKALALMRLPPAKTARKATITAKAGS